MVLPAARMPGTGAPPQRITRRSGPWSWRMGPLFAPVKRVWSRSS